MDRLERKEIVKDPLGGGIGLLRRHGKSGYRWNGVIPAVQGGRGHGQELRHRPRLIQKPLIGIVLEEDQSEVTLGRKKDQVAVKE